MIILIFSAKNFIAEEVPLIAEDKTAPTFVPKLLIFSSLVSMVVFKSPNCFLSSPKKASDI